MTWNQIKRITFLLVAIIAIVAGSFATQTSFAQQGETPVVNLVAPGGTDVFVNVPFDVELHCETNTTQQALFSCFADVTFSSADFQVNGVTFATPYTNYQQFDIDNNNGIVANVGAVAGVTQPNNTLVATLEVVPLQTGNLTMQAVNTDAGTEPFYEITIYEQDGDKRGSAAFNGLTVSATVDPSPFVQTSNPDNNATNVPIDSNISLTINESVTPTNTGGISFVCQPGNINVSYSFSRSGNTFTLDPDNNLPFGRTCTLDIPGDNFEDSAGNTLLGDEGEGDSTYTLVFSVDQRPRVTNTSPEEGEQIVPVGANLEITFSESVRPSGSGGATLFCQPGNVRIGFDASRNGNTFILDTRRDLPRDSSCTFSVATSLLQDLNGNNLNDTDGNNDGFFRLNFDTETSAPFLASTSPENGASGVALDSNIVLTFSEQIQRPVARGVRFNCQPSGNRVGVTLSNNNPVFTLNPRNDLPADSTCTLSIPLNNIRDLDGNALVDTDGTPDSRYNLVFDTASAPVVSAGEVEVPTMEVEEPTVEAPVMEAPVVEETEPETVEEIEIPSIELPGEGDE